MKVIVITDNVLFESCIIVEERSSNYSRNIGGGLGVHETMWDDSH